MSRTTFQLDEKQFDTLQRAMQNYGDQAGRAVDDVLHNEGGKFINDEIMRLLPASGRKWRGKKTAAKRTQPFTQDNGSLSVTIRTKSAYNYLYFPDDGTNTKHHIGYKGKPREFMMHGAENQTSEIIDRCITRLIRTWESD